MGTVVAFIALLADNRCFANKYLCQLEANLKNNNNNYKKNDQQKESIKKSRNQTETETEEGVLKMNQK